MNLLLVALLMLPGFCLAQYSLPPRPPKLLSMGFYIPPYKGEIEQFDPSDIIEGEEAIRKDDEEQARKNKDQQDGKSVVSP